MDDLSTIVESLHSLVVNCLVRGGYKHQAEDVAQQMVYEVFRQPRTREFVLDHVDEIMSGRMPGRLRRRMRSKAHGLISRFVQVENSNDLPVVDDGVFRDQARLHASWAVEELIEHEPWLQKVVEAQQHGCSTGKEVSEYLHMS
jgi:hypothetical protein